MQRGSSGLGRAVGACFTLLAGAAALYFAVHLILSIWVPLVIIAGCVFAGIGTLAFFWRRRGW